jgi:hypothetical protein
MQLQLNFDADESEDRIDLLVFKVVRVINEISNQPLLVRAQLLSLIEVESKDVATQTFDQLNANQMALRQWANWYKETFK